MRCRKPSIPYAVFAPSHELPLSPACSRFGAALGASSPSLHAPLVVATAFPMTTAALDLKSRVDEFLRWFQALDGKDQEELMGLVYSEHKVRDVVRSFSAMPVEQRKAVFQRLGLPNDMLNRIPPPATGASGDVEVEWQEWDSSRSA